MRLARADTGTSVGEWLKFPAIELSDWCRIVNDEAEILEKELEKRRKSGR